ncbi:hypothetical protein DL239_11350 [Sedimentitalea sp. CY04]|uniref:Uncharacterized protein n=1 Tax=Parasedimentitalea denitrificans TaxID=2211118 RepID=A0ABX0WAB2_9RHOB|nr:hypothetical protein [Sedimentitalea sp. CY04]NIZ61572.1 hypothetical protein [Sedimentitalea sp. CY04]
MKMTKKLTMSFDGSVLVTQQTSSRASGKNAYHATVKTRLTSSHCDPRMHVQSKQSTILGPFASFETGT